MKLKLLVVALTLASTSVFAQSSVSIGYGDRKMDANGQHVSVTQLSAKTRLFSTIDGDFGINQAKNTVTNSITDRTEIGLSSGYEVTNWAKVTFRAATGIKNVSGKDGVTYYSLEPGVNFKLPIEDLTARVAYRYRDSYQAQNNDKLQTMRYTLSYDVTKKDRISVNYDDAYAGFNTYNQIGVAYTRSF